MKQPKVTVITAVYNDVAHIAQTMDSVLNQTFADIEYIVIDGGSTDGTVDVIKKYADRLAYWVSERDAGIADAMNKGIDRATGEYINFINSGDYFVDEAVFTKIFGVPRSGDILYGSFIGNFNGRAVTCLAPDSVAKTAWQGMPVCHSTLFARRDVLQKFKLSTTLRVSPDVDFVLRCVKSGYTFEKINVVIFKVGTLGNSAEHWLRARYENWLIARKYFPGLKTDFWHWWHMISESLFRTLKAITSVIGLYQGVRWLYRTYVRQRFPLLPKNVKPLDE